MRVSVCNHQQHLRTCALTVGHQGLAGSQYERQKTEVADGIVARLEAYFPGISKAIVFRCVDSVCTVQGLILLLKVLHFFGIIKS